MNLMSFIHIFCIALIIPSSLICSVQNPLPPGKSPSTPDITNYTIINPTSKAELKVTIYRPRDSTGGILPAIILIPGGIADSSGLISPGGMAEVLSATGYSAVVFDADGRGESGGKEDFNGIIHQDGLAEVVRFTASLPDVDARQIGILSYSYGVTMATGALARFPDLPLNFYIDWEGPANRMDTTTGCKPNASGKGRIPWKPCTDEDYWAEREAVNFIKNITVPYLRVQSEIDHVQPDVSNAIDMINAAVEGDVPWVRLNSDPINITYDSANPPVLIKEREARHQTAMMTKFVIEMTALFRE